jgi:hypothetical protein
MVGRPDDGKDFERILYHDTLLRPVNTECETAQHTAKRSLVGIQRSGRFETTERTDDAGFERLRTGASLFFFRIHFSYVHPGTLGYRTMYHFLCNLNYCE